MILVDYVYWLIKLIELIGIILYQTGKLILKEYKLTLLLLKKTQKRGDQNLWYHQKW